MKIFKDITKFSDGQKLGKFIALSYVRAQVEIFLFRFCEVLIVKNRKFVNFNSVILLLLYYGYSNF